MIKYFWSSAITDGREQIEIISLLLHFNVKGEIMIRKLLLALFLPTLVMAQDFDTYFKDKTLRLDYVFGGNASDQFVFVDELNSLPQWAGRTHHLCDNILEGNAQVRVYDKESSKLIYIQGFSTLFQEWLSTDEAKTTSKSFENVVLVPFPKDDIKIEVVFFDAKGNEEVKLKHTVSPGDILIHTKGVDKITPHTVLHKAKDEKKAIEVVFVAEGFKKDEMDLFYNYAKTAMDEIFKHKPFGNFEDRFTFYAVESASEDSGVSVPRVNDWKNTAVSSNFDTFYSERYLTTNSLKKLHDLLAGIPYEHIIILANTEVYGGGGIYNAYTLTTTGNPKFKPVVVHEFGHSFAGLADEYFYESDVLSGLISTKREPWEQNITTLVNFESKWKDKLGRGTPIPTPLNMNNKYPVGVYEGLEGNEIYRASLECRMRTNEYDKFCSICQDAIRKLILFYTEN